MYHRKDLALAHSVKWMLVRMLSEDPASTFKVDHGFDKVAAYVKSYLQSLRCSSGSLVLKPFPVICW